MKVSFRCAWSMNLEQRLDVRISRTVSGDFVEFDGIVFTRYGVVSVSAGHKPGGRWGYAHLQFVMDGRLMSYSAKGEPKMSKRQLAYWAHRVIRECAERARQAGRAA